MNMPAFKLKIGPLIALALLCWTLPSYCSETSFYDLRAQDISGKTINFSEYRGKVVLLVNTAVHCGFTAQLKDLQELYEKYKDRGFVVLGFPSADFGDLEQESDKEVKKFCSRKYGVTFPMFSKDHILGDKKQPVYKFLTEQCGEKLKGEIGFTFEKFIVNKSGMVEARFGSFTNPMSLRVREVIEELLSEES